MEHQARCTLQWPSGPAADQQTGSNNLYHDVITTPGCLETARAEQLMRTIIEAMHEFTKLVGFVHRAAARSAACTP
jgi:hypothetical protein